MHYGSWIEPDDPLGPDGSVTFDTGTYYYLPAAQQAKDGEVIVK